MQEADKLQSMIRFIKKQTNIIPKIGIVLGSGLGQLFDVLEEQVSIGFMQIPYFPKSTVAEHAGKLVVGKYKGQGIVLMRGRIHFYEGYHMNEVVRPIRMMKMLGVEKIILTNAAGAINDEYKVDDIVVISDHIASFVPNPLRGIEINGLGTRFPDMSKVYDSKIVEEIKQIGESLGISIKEGVYLQTSGPSFESKAEIRMYKRFGADVVGMSTACEAIAAVHLGMKVGGISFISNKACGLSANKLSMEEVIQNSNKNMRQYTIFMEKLAERLLGGDFN